MPSDRSDAAVLTIRYVGGRGQRLIFDPDGDGGYLVEERALLNGGGWKFVGEDIAEAVAVENADTVTDTAPAPEGLARHLRAALETCDDPDTAFHLRHALQLAEGAEVIEA